MSITDMMKSQKRVLNGIQELLHKNDTSEVRAALDEKCGPNAFDDLEKYCDEMSRAADTAIALEEMTKKSQPAPKHKSKPAPKSEPEEDDESFLD